MRAPGISNQGSGIGYQAKPRLIPDTCFPIPDSKVGAARHGCRPRAAIEAPPIYAAAMRCYFARA